MKKIENYDTLLEIVKKRKIRWFGRAGRAKGTMANNILKGKVEMKRSRGRPARQWLEDVQEWTGLSLNEMWREPEDRVAWRKRVNCVDSNGLNSLWELRY